MAKIYWFTGQHNAGKTVLGKKLTEFLSTEKRNWRSKVFHIDSEYFSNLTEVLTEDEETIRVQQLSEYIYRNGCDVVVSITSPNINLRDEFKNKIGSDIEEFYVHTSKRINKGDLEMDNYTPPTSNFFDVDTTKDNPMQSFTKIVYYLKQK